jgi:hypothetical protein
MTGNNEGVDARTKKQPSARPTHLQTRRTNGRREGVFRALTIKMAEPWVYHRGIAESSPRAQRSDLDLQDEIKQETRRSKV